MIELTLAFWIFVIISGVTGAMRGWSKEILVTASVTVALAIISLLTSFAATKGFIPKEGSTGYFWLQTIILVVMVIAGYQTPAIVRFASGKFERETIVDGILGFFIGLINGYLIYGSIWYFMSQAGYPFPGITEPKPVPPIVNYLPPVYLTGNWAYAAMAVSFIFVIFIFI